MTKPDGFSSKFEVWVQSIMTEHQIDEKTSNFDQKLG
jgi:hypothetical protein